ncbi:hypothetical protein HA402_008417 [Bradysia odoriphaga]|nr:hypothetical protein HA402_008417 [Bradysia odoriphaga]
MAGRGRPATSLTQEQLMALGVNSKEMQSVTNAPPPIFPPLFSKPAPLETRNARDYKILWKEDFVSYLKDSPYYTNPTVDQDKKIQRYSDKYIQVFSKTKDRKNSDFAWERMPVELRPNWKRKKETVGARKKIKVVNIEETLKVLEEKEKVKVPDVVEKESDADDNDEEEIDEHDEEMDEDNDYGNSYFDNGDAYNDEDDNLDDGPVY